MFTGIIEEIGIVKKAKKSEGGIKLEISAPKSVKELRINDSVSINGVCQTVVAKSKITFTVESVEETLKKTTFTALEEGKKVNIELPLRVQDRLGGHMVLGHVDAVGRIKKIQKMKSSWLVTLSFPAEFSKYIIPEGSIAIDGVSLTIASHETNELIVSIIPHTMENTIFTEYKSGSKVNLEFDIVGKYIERLTSTGEHSHKKSVIVTESELRKLGF
jgi:riboflavin synthase